MLPMFSTTWLLSKFSLILSIKTKMVTLMSDHYYFMRGKAKLVHLPGRSSV